MVNWTWLCRDLSMPGWLSRDGLVIALPVGIYSAIRQDTAADFLGRSVAIIGLATPNFWLRHYGHDLPSHLVGLGAAAGAGCLHRRPAGESGGVPHSQPDSGNGLGCRHHADDAHHDAGGAEAGTISAPPGPRG